MASRTLPVVAQRLIAAGMPATTQAVAIENVSRSDERTIFASLGELPEQLAESGISGPTLVLIGSVVALAQERTAIFADAA